ncbi:1-deoxy-D-xylulose-5-phosphate reductoisomerase [Saccharicrinis fermentans]|uniref:1-deoxy-D-xylulose 5-phosphate reductoisomerase n=1 Tax=Saccharicrinis fermentans DSM 9555 = JCM 21142 TaxID=869213 RepID=W7Y5K8_9BACT|nr:1-deoxy-D-xylulose-5-phosphate reductoisomerase [Saccharicrinis fermentans]GAF02858.1 1-deoxy-D-xylulose 5-phosphate reductoisomerase [Saccharicrinis fermentans DSM 9555 = JCM 21142]
MKKRIAVLGSTGSIGTQTLDVISKHPDKFEVEVLTANNRIGKLVEQCRKFVPNTVVIGNEAKYKQLQDALEDLPIKVYAGADAIAQVVEMGTVDVVLTAMVGFSGLQPTMNAIKAGKCIALANKETLVVAGDIITEMAASNKVPILPVDSEHSAIFQCLVGEFQNPIEKIYLTASGGPFRGKDRAFLENVTPEQALNHPNWEMGNKITIDSASMMNKGLEVIEARWLFGLTLDQIDVIVHPQSIVHSIVQYTDGSMKAQMGLPDMRLPIQYALTYPERCKVDFPRFNFLDYPNLSFEKTDLEAFRNLAIAYEALRKGGNMPCIMNAANEIVVEAFLEKKIAFLDMPGIIEETMVKSSFLSKPTMDDYFETDAEARKIAQSFIGF